MSMRPLTVLGAAGLWLTSLQAPFSHFHPQDPDHHHSSGFAHVHLGHASESHHVSSEQPELEDHDDEETAVSQEWIPAGSARVQGVYIQAAIGLIFNPGVVSLGVAPEFTVRSHDPPGLRLLPTRAPPV